MVRQAEVVIGAEVEYLTPIGHSNLDPLGGGDEPLFLIVPLSPDLIQLREEVFFGLHFEFAQRSSMYERRHGPIPNPGWPCHSCPIA